MLYLIFKNFKDYTPPLTHFPQLLINSIRRGIKFSHLILAGFFVLKECKFGEFFLKFPFGMKNLKKPF